MTAGDETEHHLRFVPLAVLLKFRLMGGERAVRPRSEPPDGERCGYEQTMPFHHSAA